MSEHTPGPWRVETFQSGSGTRRSIFAAAKFPIAQVCGDPRPAAQNEANAHLIAAAPDFAEVAPDAADLLQHYADYIQELPADELERHPYLPLIENVVRQLRAAISKATRQEEENG